MESLLLLAALTLSMLLVPLLRSVALRYDIMDSTGDPLKIHEAPTPYMGGVAFGVAYLVTLIVWLALQGSWTADFSTLIICGLIVAALGLMDDIVGLKPSIRLVAQLCLGLVLAYVGLRINLFPSALIGAILTAVFVAGMINAINMFDGLDGLAGGVAILSALGFSVVFNAQHSPYLFASLSLVAVVFGFLVHNFNPATVFMGDAGSYFLGLTLAVFAISLMNDPWDFRSVFGVVFLLGMPLFDSIVTVLTRIYNGSPPMAGDRNHLYDRLHQRVGNVRTAVLCFYGLQVFSVMVGLWLILK